jgi:hypothetical protein
MQYHWNWTSISCSKCEILLITQQSSCSWRSRPGILLGVRAIWSTFHRNLLIYFWQLTSSSFLDFFLVLVKVLVSTCANFPINFPLLFVICKYDKKYFSKTESWTIAVAISLVNLVLKIECFWDDLVLKRQTKGYFKCASPWQLH